MKATQLRRIRWAVRGALTLGIVASVAANVLHAEPNAIAQVISAWPPVALLITVELVARLEFKGWISGARLVGTAVIAGIAAYVSYFHMAGVALRYGESASSAYLLPISVDGLIAVASVSLVELARRIKAASTVELPTASTPDGDTKTSPAAVSSPQASTEVAEENTTPPGEVFPPGALNTDSADLRKAYALFKLTAGEWTVEQSAAHSGISVRRFQIWADDVPAKTRKARGGPRKSTGETTDAVEPVSAPPAPPINGALVPVAFHRPHDQSDTEATTEEAGP